MAIPPANLYYDGDAPLPTNLWHRGGDLLTDLNDDTCCCDAGCPNPNANCPACNTSYRCTITGLQVKIVRVGFYCVYEFNLSIVLPIVSSRCRWASNCTDDNCADGVLIESTGDCASWTPPWIRSIGLNCANSSFCNKAGWVVGIKLEEENCGFTGHQLVDMQYVLSPVAGCPHIGVYPWCGGSGGGGCVFLQSTGTVSIS